MEMPSHTKESSDGDTKGLELLGRSAMRKAIVAASIFWYLAVGRSVGRTRASTALWDDVGLAPTSSIGNAARGTSFIGSFIHYRLLVREWTHKHMMMLDNLFKYNT